jgi:hypothetical protein
LAVREDPAEPVKEEHARQNKLRQPLETVHLSPLSQACFPAVSRATLNPEKSIQKRQ